MGRPGVDFPPRIIGAIAQLGERLICIQEVVGSIPASSTSFLNEEFCSPVEHDMFFDNVEIDVVAFLNDTTLVKLLRAYGECLGTWSR